MEPPHSLWEASLLFQQKHLGAGEATGQKRGVEGRRDSQPKTRVPTCPRACGKSLSCFGPQCPHPYREGRELDKGSPTQTPSGSRWNSAPKRVPRMCRPGAARTFGFEKQSEKSGFLCVITSSLNIRKTFSRPMKQESGPESAHGPPLVASGLRNRFGRQACNGGAQKPGGAPSPARAPTPVRPPPPTPRIPAGPATSQPLTSARAEAGSGPG